MSQSQTADMVKQLLAQLQKELSLSQSLGSDTPEGAKHLTRAHQLKNQLMQIQLQFTQRKENAVRAQQAAQAKGGIPQSIQDQSLNNSAATPAGGQQGRMMPGMTPSLQQQQQLRYAQMQQRMGQQQQFQGGPQASMAQNQVPQGSQPGAANSTPAGAPGARTTNINAANGFQQRFNQVDELRRHHAAVTARIEQHEQALRTRTNPVEITRIQQQLDALKQRREMVRRRESVLMRDLRQALSQPAQNATGNQQGGSAQNPGVNPAPSTANTANTPNGAAAVNAQLPPAARLAQIQQQMLRGIPRNAQGQPVPANQIQATRLEQLRQLQMRVRRQNGAAGAAVVVGNAAGAAGQAAPSAPMPGSSDVPAAGTSQPQGAAGPSMYNSSVMIPPTSRPLSESMVIPNQLNVSSIQPSTARAGRPTLTSGGANDAQSLNSPGLVRPPHVDMSGDRLLSKRKLSDLVTNIIGEDQEPLIDGDVEELLLDLADEFVSNVTQFACKLARHRKSDILEAKDIHMHLERNWNMHIAGYSSDEVRSIRRFLPAQAYQQKIQSILMAKSVQK